MAVRLSLAAAAALIALALATSTWAASEPSGPDPAVAQWPDWPYPVTCGGPDEAFDPLVVFSGPTGAEAGSSPAERALRRTIEEQRTWAEPLVAGGSWRLVSETETQAQFTRGRLAGTLESVGFNRGENGAWRLSGYSGDCDPEVVVEGRTVVDWSLSRKQKRLNPRSRTLWVDLGGGECASGTPQNPRAGFRFRTLGTKLLMIASLRPVRGGGTCLGTIEPPRKVRLPAPLGELHLYDGSTFPPVPAGKTRGRYY
jgi:hypothetical protein